MYITVNLAALSSVIIADKAYNYLLDERRAALFGAPEQPLPIAAFGVIIDRKNFAGLAIGGIKETQKMLDFCARTTLPQIYK